MIVKIVLPGIQVGCPWCLRDVEWSHAQLLKTSSESEKPSHCSKGPIEVLLEYCI